MEKILWWREERWCDACNIWFAIAPHTWRVWFCRFEVNIISFLAKWILLRFVQKYCICAQIQFMISECMNDERFPAMHEISSAVFVKWNVKGKEKRAGERFSLTHAARTKQSMSFRVKYEKTRGGCAAIAGFRAENRFDTVVPVVCLTTNMKMKDDDMMFRGEMESVQDESRWFQESVPVNSNLRLELFYSIVLHALHKYSIEAAPLRL